MEFKDNMLNDGANEQINNQIEEINPSTEELSNISLADSQDEQESNKKKYLILSLALLTLFIITIIVIKFISNVNDDENTLTPQESKIKQDNILENINAEQRYQEIIKKRVETLQKDEQVTPPTEEETLAPQPVVKETPTPKPVAEKKPEPVKVEKKKEELKPLKKESSVPVPQTTSFVKDTPLQGSFIQLGAFSKYPSSKYLKNIKNRGYNYKVHKVNVKGKTYHKVLVGPYKSKKESKQILNEIRKDLKSPKAFVFK